MHVLFSSFSLPILNVDIYAYGHMNKKTIHKALTYIFVCIFYNVYNHILIYNMYCLVVALFKIKNITMGLVVDSYMTEISAQAD